VYPPRAKQESEMLSESMGSTITNEATIGAREEEEADRSQVRPAGGAVIAAAGVTDTGKVRPVNQDVFGIWPEIGLCVLADGMGGRPAGDVAARLAVMEVHKFLACCEPDRTPPMAWDVTRGLAAGMLVRAIEHANAVVHSNGFLSAARRGMGTTVAALLVAGPRVVVAHVGDSRVYRFRGGALQKLTEDHSHAELYLKWRGEQADPGVYKENQHALTQAIGPAPVVRVTVHVEDIAAGDVFLLCSDGLWNGVPHETIAEVLAGSTSLDTTAGMLVAKAIDAGGLDNITAVLVRPLRALCSGH